MEETPVEPHILIEGRIPLTEMLWHRCRGPKPIVLSSNIPVMQEVSWFRRRYQDEWGDAPVHRLFGAFLIMRHRNEGVDWVGSVEALSTLLALARARFGLKNQPVRIICAGSHEWLWVQEHSGQGPLLASHGAQTYLAALRRRRQYAVRLFEALAAQDRVKLHWVTEGFPFLRPPVRTLFHHDVAAQARQAQLDETPPDTIIPTIPRLYTRLRRDGEWTPFPGADGRAPYTTTSKLIDQYRTSREHREGYECVLTKLLPHDEEWLNPCDCPIITLEQRKEAVEAGISTILLDRRFGVIEPDFDRRTDDAAQVFAV